MNSGQPQVLVIDDDPAYNQVLCRALTRRGLAAAGALDPEQALRQAELHRPAYLVLDLNLGGRSGLNLIQPLLTLCPGAALLVLTGYASIPTAVGAIKLGAKDYLAKPADVDAILRALTGAAVVMPNQADEEVMSVQRLEWEHIQRVLTEQGGNITAAARALRMHRRTLQRKLAKRPPQG